jgi:RluA family pseudouridine synthase
MEKQLFLLEKLKILYPDSSNRTLLHWIKQGRVLVNGTVVRKNIPFVEGSSFTLSAKERVLSMQVKIYYEDRSCIVIEKPKNVLSLATEFSQEPTAFSVLRGYSPKANILPVHRLDRDASGIMMFAKGEKNQELFSSLFARHEVQREYIAIVEGHVPQDFGVLEHYLLELKNFHVIATTPEEGKKAITHFSVIKRTAQHTILFLTLETGKKHQIRVQCKEMGHPVVGDERYGKKDLRLFLHAKNLIFTHPWTKKKISLSSPIPQVFFQKAGFAFDCREPKCIDCSEQKRNTTTSSEEPSMDSVKHE